MSEIRTAAPVEPARSPSTLPPSPMRFRQRSHAVRAKAIAFGRAIVGALVASALLEVVVEMHLVSTVLLPHVWDIEARAFTLLGDHKFLIAVTETLKPTVYGLALAAAIGIPAGQLIGVSRVASKMTQGTVDLLRSVPSVAIIPLLVLTVGQGQAMETIVVTYISIWPILFNTIYGAQGVDAMRRDAARSYGLTEIAVWRRVVLPGSLPLVLTGMRVALPLALTMAVSAEIAVGTPRGIGGFILVTSNTTFDARSVYAAVLLAGVLGFLMTWAATVAADYLCRWDITS